MIKKEELQKKSILVICPFPYGVTAGQRMKYEQYFNNWRKDGYRIIISPFMSNNMWKVVYLKGKYFHKINGTFAGYFRRFYNLFIMHKYDIVYVHMWVTPFGSTFFERLTRLLSKKLIYDIEDNTISHVSNSVNKIIAPLKNPNKNKFLMRLSDYVIVSSPTLNDYCTAINVNSACEYISSSVDTDRFIPVNTYSNNKKVTIGWTGTFSSVEYLDSLRGSLKELKTICDFKLIIIGNFEYKFEEMDLEVIQWSSENEVSDLQKIDIGIYPLNNDSWVYGKSGLKAIQYMAFGLPTVATNIGTTPKIIKHMNNGLLVNSDDEWVSALEMLINNPGLRKSIGSAARKTIVNRYSKNVIGKKYSSIINKVYKG